jgi:hypothetical protein
MVYPTHGSEYHERQSWKRPCRAATTVNVTIATALNAGDTIDGVTLAAGDRVLVKDQTTASQNGIYVAGASPARAIDFASSAEIVGGAVVVTEGTTNGGRAWLCDTPAPITVGTTAISFTGLGSGGGSIPQISGTGTGTIEFTDGTETVIIASTVGEFRLDESTGFVRMRTAAGAIGVNLRTTDDQLALWAEHTAGDLANAGLNIEVGEDYVGLYISEKDAATIQVYDDSGGDYDIELVEQDPAHHFKFVHPSGGVAIPALGMLPRYSSAPHAGVEQEGESYFDTTLNRPRIWDGAAWVSATAADPGDIPVPSTATAQDVAEKLNDLMAAMRAVGMLV